MAPKVQLRKKSHLCLLFVIYDTETDHTFNISFVHSDGHSDPNNYARIVI